jgi:hypothetical protein
LGTWRDSCKHFAGLLFTVTRMIRPSSASFLFSILLLPAVASEAGPIDAFRQPRAAVAPSELGAGAPASITVDPNVGPEPGADLGLSLGLDPNEPLPPLTPGGTQPQAVPEPLTLALLGLGLLMLGFIGRKLTG